MLMVPHGGATQPPIGRKYVPRIVQRGGRAPSAVRFRGALGWRPVRGGAVLGSARSARRAGLLPAWSGWPVQAVGLGRGWASPPTVHFWSLEDQNCTGDAVASRPAPFIDAVPVTGCACRGGEAAGSAASASAARSVSPRCSVPP